MDSKIIKYFLLIFFISFKVSAVEFDGKFIQGHFIIGKTEPDTKVKIDKKQVKVSKDGYFAFGLARDRKYDVIITIEKNGVKKKITKKTKAIFIAHLIGFPSDIKRIKKIIGKKKIKIIIIN